MAIDTPSTAQTPIETARSDKPPVPQVSIGMPVYNGEPFIREALDSLLAQTFTDFELIISDNASTDGTEAICREYAAKDARIRYVRQVENRGAMPNFQFVLDEALGEYFMWAAADDVWLPKFIETCVKLLKTDASAQMAMTGYKCVSRFSPVFNRTFPAVLSLIEITNTEDRVLLYAKQPFSTHKDNLVYSLWRRSFIKEVISEIRSALMGRLIVGASMNEYALLKAPGRYAAANLFLKRYRYVPPGHWAGPWVGHFAHLIKIILGKRGRSKAAGYGGQQHLADLGALLSASESGDDLTDRIINANKQYVRVV